MTDRRLDDSAVVRRLNSNVTHVAEVRGVWRAHFIKDYWAPTGSLKAACGVQIRATDVIMETGTKARCRACVHATGVTEQSPAVHEHLDTLVP